MAYGLLGTPPGSTRHSRRRADAEDFQDLRFHGLRVQELSGLLVAHNSCLGLLRDRLTFLLLLARRTHRSFPRAMKMPVGRYARKVPPPR